MARSVRSLAGLEAAMADTPLLTEIPRKAIRDLIDEGLVRDYRRGTYLFHQGDPAPDVLFLWSGRVEISSVSATGHRQLLTTLEHPQFFGELGVLGDMRRTATAEALEESTVWAVTGESWLGFLAQHFPATRSLLRALARQIQSAESFVEDLLFLDLKGRVAKRLLGLVSASLEELPEDGVMLPSVVTHADLASLSGGSRENVTRILSELQRRGIVDRAGRRYLLKNVKALARLAGL
ncbi:MAG TPA: Crp/Fnr family transcriptional regulator [Actinomycetota bacterium]|jgi:CRP-like cAMP-binding protein|nr:Crp/Fnr family transcriptional regulator [Actinomycetota bacterium]